MQNKTWKKISQNPNLVSFCNKILNYNTILEDETSRSMFLVMLISSDSLIDKESCNETIEVSNFILNNINLMILEDNIKESVINHLKTAIEIAERDKKLFK